MAGFLDFLGGAAGAYAQVKTEDRQRKQIEEYNKRLREQEMEDWKYKLEYQEKLNAGKPLGTPQLVPSTGQFMGLVQGQPGEAPSLQSFGEVPGAREAYEAEQAFERQKQELALAVQQGKLSMLDYDKALKSARTDTARAQAYAASQSGALSAARRENPELYGRGAGASASPRETAFVEDRAIRDAALAEGYVYDSRTGRILTGVDGEPVPAETAAAIRRKAKAKPSTSGEFNPESFLSQFN